MAVLHNIGALHTILGAQDSRANPDGMKSACAHFQCAVWAFQVHFLFSLFYCAQLIVV